MKPQAEHSKPRTLADIGYYFLWGIVFGLVLALIPLAISTPAFTLWNIYATGGLVLVCGTLSALVGKRFLHALMRLLEFFPPVA